MKFFFNILLIYFFLVGNSFSKILSINDDFKLEVSNNINFKKIKKKDFDKNSITENIVEQLEKLNDLCKSGVLTKEEFEKAKKRILN